VIKTGYSTNFEGGFKFNKPLHPKLKGFIEKFNTSRRMKRRLPKGLYGIEGEFYIDGKGDYGQGDEANIIDSNSPPKTQPGLWCQWTYDQENNELIWDGGEKFYEYIPWLEYLINKIFAPNGYKLNGIVHWRGEEMLDIGTIIVKDNKVKVIEGRFK
jgi:hypothetical protein